MHPNLGVYVRLSVRSIDSLSYRKHHVVGRRQLPRRKHRVEILNRGLISSDRLTLVSERKASHGHEICQRFFTAAPTPSFLPTKDSCLLSLSCVTRFAISTSTPSACFLQPRLAQGSRLVCRLRPHFFPLQHVFLLGEVGTYSCFCISCHCVPYLVSNVLMKKCGL